MAYTVNKTDGSIFASVADGTVNTDSSIVLVGKNYAGYGEFIAENMIRMLENSANATAPANPLRGQLWYDSNAGLLKVYNGTTFKNLGAATSQATAPTSNVLGDMWFDTVNTQLKIWDGSQFIVVGPAFTAGTGVSGSIVEVITDNVAVDHVVIKLYAEDEVVGIVSKDAEFTPAAPFSGFTGTIKPGIQLASDISGQTPLFIGKATNADTLDGIDSTGFLSATANDSTSGILSILNDGGLIVGADSDGKLYISGVDMFLENTTTDGDLILRVNDGGVPTAVITIDGATARASTLSPTSSTHIATKGYVDTAVGTIGTDALQRDGSNTITGNILPSADNVRNLGSGAARFANVYAVTFAGKATTAQYADLAERFASDAAYAPGTVVMLGGAAEISAAQDELSEEVFGVISSEPAFMMNSNAGTDETHPPVAMSGRVPVRVIGSVKKGQRLVSAGNGLARAAQPGEATAFNVIGRALEDKLTSGEGVIEAFVTVN